MVKKQDYKDMLGFENYVPQRVGYHRTCPKCAGPLIKQDNQDYCEHCGPRDQKD